MNTVATYLGAAILLLIATLIILSLFYLVVQKASNTLREFWLVVDYHLNRKAYREWLKTNPKRDRRGIAEYERDGGSAS